MFIQYIMVVDNSFCFGGFWGIAGNSPIFPEHIYFLNPRPVPTVSEKTVLVPVPEYWRFSVRGTICPQNGFPSPPRNSPKHFHKALPIPAPSPKLGEGDGFPQVSRPRLASLIHTLTDMCIHTARFSVRRFDYFDHLSKRTLKQMILHLKALIPS